VTYADGWLGLLVLRPENSNCVWWNLCLAAVPFQLTSRVSHILQMRILYMAAGLAFDSTSHWKFLLKSHWKM
jgi:hypothetical protein